MNSSKPSKPASSNASQELSLADALALAIYLHRSEAVTEAETLYRKILEAAPGNPDAIHYLGVLLHQRDRSDEAIDLIERSIALDPDNADRYNNLGNVLVERGRIAEASEAYRKVITLTPEHGEAWNNLGTVLRSRGQLEEAAAAYQKAIELNPENVPALNNFGNLLAGQGQVKEAVSYYCKAITLVPGNPDSRRLLGIAYYTLEEYEAAAEVYREWLRDDPGNPIAQHMLAACSGKDVPQRASDDFITATFDSFAGSFDQKLESLSYRAPQLVTEATENFLPSSDQKIEVLDAGCGTGLCGPLIAPFATRLVGVDLSSKMLAVARTRQVYDELVIAELTAFLTEQTAVFDLIVSADTLVYFGELDSVFNAAANALKPCGLLVFTLEKAKDQGTEEEYRINPHGRYSHSRSYVVAALEGAGFEPLSVEMAVLRMESGSPVDGFVVAARLADAKKTEVV